MSGVPVTREKYFSMLVRLFCYIQYNNMLFTWVFSPTLMGELQEAELHDSEKRKRRGAPSKKQDVSKQVIVDAIKSINSQDLSPSPSALRTLPSMALLAS